MNLVWKVFFLVISGVVFLLGGKLAYSLYGYMCFDLSVPAKIDRWKIVETAPSEYRLVAEYSYVLEKEHLGTHLFQKPKYGNNFIAQKHLADLEKKTWQAYVNSKKPYISSLQHNFPFKRFFHFCLGIGILIYFVWLKNYVLTRYAVDQ